MYASSIDIFISCIITYTFHKEIFQNHQSSILAVFISCSRHQTLHSNVGTLQTHNGSRYEKTAILFLLIFILYYAYIGPTQVKCWLLISSIFYATNFWLFLEMLEFYFCRAHNFWWTISAHVPHFACPFIITWH